MNEAEIMNCAAILAAGIMANQCGAYNYNAETAVALMREIAAEIEKPQKEEKAETPEYF